MDTITITIAIVADEAAYGEALAKGLGQCSRQILVTLFRGDKIHNNEECFDVILWDSRELPGENWSSGTLIFLVERKGAAEKEILKYQRIHQLWGDVLTIYALETGRSTAGLCGKEWNAFAFAGFEGGCGCTTMTMATAIYFARYRKKRALYLSLEEQDSGWKYMKMQVENPGISAYLYYLLGRKQSQLSTTGFVVESRQGVWAFNQDYRSQNPLLSLSEEEMAAFADAVFREFDFVLVDCGQSLSPPALWIREYAKNTFFLGGDVFFEEKMQKLTQSFSQKKQDSLYFVENRRGYDSTVKMGNFVLHQDSDSFSCEEGVLFIDLDKGFGMEISQIMTELT